MASSFDTMGLFKILLTAIAVRATYSLASAHISIKQLSDTAMYATYVESVTKLRTKLGMYSPLAEDGKTRIGDRSEAPEVYKEPSLDPSQNVSLMPYKIRGVTLRNRVIRGAAYDGIDTEELLAIHKSVAAGGVGMTVVAYCSTARNGRTFDGQIVLTDVASSVKVLKPVTDAVHAEGGHICAQLTHAGYFADRSLNPENQNVSASRIFSKAGFDFSRAASLKELDDLARGFAESARVAVQEVGFDAVELHCGHGYLLSQFLCPNTNLRTDKYGGSPENRARFPVECLIAIRKAVGENVPILVKMNYTDGEYNGVEVSDAKIYAELFARNGADLIVGSAGMVGRNSLYMLRGPANIGKVAAALPPPLMNFAAFLFGPWAIDSTPFEECFLRDSGRACVAHLKKLGLDKQCGMCLLGGVSSLGNMEGAIAEGFHAVQIVRPLIREPDFLLRIRRELDEARAQKQAASSEGTSSEDSADEVEKFDIASKCIRCNQCVLASIDAEATNGCPFLRMELAAKARAAETSQPTHGLSVSPTSARMMIADIEDLGGGVKMRRNKL